MLEWIPNAYQQWLHLVLAPLAAIAKREVDNQADLFSLHQLFIQRVLSVLASSASIVFCVVGIYLLLAIDPRRLIFRHHLIFFLLCFDLLKAVVLLLYPARVLNQATSYNNIRFCQVVGFFTAVAIEGADIAILAFAVHTYCLIFKPSFQTKVKNSTRTEGGLYRYRYFVYFISFLFPIVFASLAFISREGYESFVCWCYLPQKPVWYRFVLSWVPRYCILITIIIIYCSIYFHVIREFKALGGMFTTMHRSHGINPHRSQDEKPTFFSALKFFFASMKDHIAPKLIIPDANELNNQHNLEELERRNRRLAQQRLKQMEEAELDDDDATENGDLDDLSAIATPKPPLNDDTMMYSPELHQSNLENFRKRQRIIEKQMKSIFIYPFAYCFIWLFPFILQSTQVNYEEKHGPIDWLNYMGAFMQPLPGFVDTTVFFYREQPWKYTAMSIFKKENKTRMDSLVNANQPTHEADDESLSTSARLTRNSLSTGLIDIQYYSAWRQWLSFLRFPLFKLPTEETVSDLQAKYINDRLLDEKKKKNVNISAGVNNLHDFSDLLSGNLIESEFRSNLETFSLNFDKKSTQRSNNRKSSVISSSKSRQYLSVDEPLQESPRTAMHTSKTTAIRNSFSNHKDGRATKKFNPDFVINKSASSTPRPSNHASSSRQSVSGNSIDDDMDFLQFLKSGPPGSN